MLAAWCGLKMEFRNENFDAIVAGQIDPKSYDIMLVAGDHHRRSRQGRRLLGPLLQGRPGSARQQGNHGRQSWDDVKKMTVGVQASTTGEFDVTSGEVPGWKLDKVKSFGDLASAYAALSAGTVDAVMMDTPINLGQAAQSGGKQEVSAQFKTGEAYGAIFGKGNGKKADLRSDHPGPHRRWFDQRVDRQVPRWRSDDGSVRRRSGRLSLPWKIW